MALPISTFNPGNPGAILVIDMPDISSLADDATVDLIRLPKGTIIAQAKLCVRTGASNGTGNTLVQVIDDQTSPVIYLGATGVNAEAAGKTDIDTATNGGAAAAIARTALGEDAILKLKLETLTGDVTVDWDAVLILDLVRPDMTAE